MRAAVFWTLVFVAIPLSGQQLAPAGEDMQVNGYTTGQQFFAAVDVEADGEFVVVWTSSDSTYGPDNSGYKIEGQLFDPDRSKAGFEFQINTYADGDQAAPALASQGDDDFVVVWQSAGSSGADTSASSILGQRMSRIGTTATPIGSEFEVNDFTTSVQINPEIAARTDSGFVVAWESYASPADDGSGGSVQARRFTSDGTPSGSQFQVNTYTYSYQRFPDVAVGPNNEFVVVWESFSSDGGATDTTSIRGRRFTSDGTPLGGDFQINTYTLGVAVNLYWYPSVAINPSGDFLVVWGSIGSPGDDNGIEEYSVQGRLYASDGTPMGSQFQINTYITGEQREPKVTGTRPDGNFLVTWHSGGSAGNDPSSSIQGRHYDSTGSPFGAEFQINTYVTGEQRSAVLGARPDGELVVVWESYGSPGNDTDQSTLLFRSILTDIDDDNVADIEDNCPMDANSGQEDEDEDGIGTACDACFGDNGSGNVDGDGFCADTDCNDNDSGASVVDACGICGGDGSTCTLFIDGFETGDTSQWDNSVP